MYTQEEKWLLREKYNGVYAPEFERDKLRLKQGEPLAYIIGSVPFLNVKIDVSLRPHTPRVETEFWTEKVIEILKTDVRKEIRCLDLFSGSGCIGIAIAKNVLHAHVDLADTDARCIQQIEKNILLNTIDCRNVRVLQSNMFSHVPGTYDYIFANPPYLATKRIDRVADSVLSFEPHRALFGGSDGMDVISCFLAECPKHLAPHGRVFMEFDDRERDAIEELVSKLSYRDVWFEKDQYGVWRYVHVSVR